MKFTPYGKLCIGLIACAAFAVYIAGFIHGATVAVEARHTTISAHNSVEKLTTNR